VWHANMALPAVNLPRRIRLLRDLRLLHVGELVPELPRIRWLPRHRLPLRGGV
jgi:hypothetical protein